MALGEIRISRLRASAVGWANAQGRRSVGGRLRRAFAHAQQADAADRRSFSEGTCDVANIATPIGRHQSARDITVKAAIGPVADPGGVSMLYRIEMNVIDMSSEVDVVADGVLPVAALPNSLVALSDLAGATPRNAG
jgi:hypothetical protein